MSVQENLRSMKTLDDSWNNQDWETFRKRTCAVFTFYWPAQAEATKGQRNNNNSVLI